uniref:Capsular polysaccharide biosynthesis glycosyltransferase CapM n=2 Tax=Anthurium amnicola TaxID=1678845 RepID=A0A1D1YK87_9ARAE
MEEGSSRGELHINVVRQNSLRPAGGLKSNLSGRSTPRSSPSFRRAFSGRTPRRESKASFGGFQWIRGKRLVFWLILITLWTYIGFVVQSKWAHNDHGKGFIGYRSERGSPKGTEDVVRTNASSVGVNATISSGVETMLLEGKRERELKETGISSPKKEKKVSTHQNVTTRKNARRSNIERKLRGNIRTKPKVVLSENATVDMDDGIPKKNTSYGLIVGPFGKTEDSILEWSAEKRKGTCDRKSDFAHLVWSRTFVLIFHELSMTGAPLSMLELATELLSCGATVSTVVLSKNGGLMAELDRRGIKVLKDKGEFSFKTAMKADLIIAGSAVCSSWIEQYLQHFTAGSSQIVWWIMENRREYFDRSKSMLNQVKMLAFLSESQSKQWLTWCEEEHIQLKSQPVVVPLSVNDELAFVAGIPCSLNTPLFSVEKMREKRDLLRVAVRKEMGLADNDTLVMSLSSINPGKGQLLLLESIRLMSEQNITPIDIKISNLLEEKNPSGIITQNLTTLNASEAKLVDDGSQSNATTGTSKKSKRKRSRSKRHGGTKIARNLLSVDENTRKPALKVLIGSIGSKSNKVPYIKGILRFLSQHSNVTKSVLWTPATTRVSSLYSAADVYVINAQGLGETFGRVTIEAMAFGLPVLGTDAGGTREIVEDKVTGLLHPIGREGNMALAQNLQFLLRNQAAREQLGRNGRFKVEKTHLKQHMFKKLAAILSKCMKVK